MADRPHWHRELLIDSRGVSEVGCNSHFAPDCHVSHQPLKPSQSGTLSWCPAPTAPPSLIWLLGFSPLAVVEYAGRHLCVLHGLLWMERRAQGARQCDRQSWQLWMLISELLKGSPGGLFFSASHPGTLSSPFPEIAPVWPTGALQAVCCAKLF